MKLKELFSEEYIEGMKQGFVIANDVCRKQGFEIKFPDIDTMEVSSLEGK